MGVIVTVTRDYVPAVCELGEDDLTQADCIPLFHCPLFDYGWVTSG